MNTLFNFFRKPVINDISFIPDYIGHVIDHVGDDLQTHNQLRSVSRSLKRHIDTLLPKRVEVILQKSFSSKIFANTKTYPKDLLRYDNEGKDSRISFRIIRAQYWEDETIFKHFVNALTRVEAYNSGYLLFGNNDIQVIGRDIDSKYSLKKEIRNLPHSFFLVIAQNYLVYFVDKKTLVKSHIENPFILGSLDIHSLFAKCFDPNDMIIKTFNDHTIVFSPREFHVIDRNLKSYTVELEKYKEIKSLETIPNSPYFYVLWEHGDGLKEYTVYAFNDSKLEVVDCWEASKVDKFYFSEHIVLKYRKEDKTLSLFDMVKQQKILQTQIPHTLSEHDTIQLTPKGVFLLTYKIFSTNGEPYQLNYYWNVKKQCLVKKELGKEIVVGLQNSYLLTYRKEPPYRSTNDGSLKYPITVFVYNLLKDCLLAYREKVLHYDRCLNYNNRLAVEIEPGMWSYIKIEELV
ncbi:hypothetical protein BN1013_01377 [Candidatus Rubidus massiliensis]|nr:hypothetical protein BN1013_01377 [Candidatus Rubidus massiliensis]